MTDKELEHHGVKGQKWGVTRTPEELGHKPKLSKRNKKMSSLLKVIKKASAARKEKSEVKKKVKEEADKKKRRDEILSDPAKLKKHYKEFSDDEVKAAIKNFETEKKLSELSTEKVKTAENWLSTVAKATTNMIITYNNTAKAYNAFFADKDGNVVLPLIKNEDKKKDKGKDE